MYTSGESWSLIRADVKYSKTGYQFCLVLVQRERQADLHKLAKALLEHETLTAAEIQQVLDGTFERAPVAKTVAETEVEALIGPVAGEEPAPAA